jgi:hypothetical protein
VIKHLVRDRNQLFPVMPLADCIFHGSQTVNKLLLVSPARHLQHIAQFFHLQSVLMQVLPVEVLGSSQLRRKPKRRCHRFRRTSIILFAQHLVQMRSTTLQSAPDHSSVGSDQSPHLFRLSRAFSAHML